MVCCLAAGGELIISYANDVCVCGGMQINISVSAIVLLAFAAAAAISSGCSGPSTQTGKERIKALLLDLL